MGMCECALKKNSEFTEQEMKKPVMQYSGFTGHTYRLVFNYEDNYNVTPHLYTILPSGVVENDKTLSPAKEGALVAYP